MGGARPGHAVGNGNHQAHRLGLDPSTPGFEVGIQTFREVRERDCYYVDKTAYIKRLLDEGKHNFLPRPRRAGKRLFQDTCKEPSRATRRCSRI